MALPVHFYDFWGATLFVLICDSFSLAKTHMNEIEIISAEETDLSTILQIQLAAFQEEAEAFGDYTIEPLLQTTVDLLREFSYRTFLKAEDNGKIVGSVRAHNDGDTVYIGKLMVHPDYQNQGLGRRLLRAAECLFPHARYELSVAKRMDKNTMLYTHCGYHQFKEVQDESGRIFIFMQKLADPYELPSK